MDGSGQGMNRLVLGLMPTSATPDTHLAAGPWCFAGQEQNFPDWEAVFSFAPEPLADKTRIPQAVRAAQTLAVQSVPKVAGLLMSQPEQLPDVYWQVLLAPWLMDLASQLVDRALRVAAMLEAFGNLPLEVEVLPKDCQFAFWDEHDFTLRGSMGILFNHWLFSVLLEPMWPETWEKITLPAQNLEPKVGAELNFAGLKSGVKSLARSLTQNLAFPHLRGVGLAETWRLASALDHVCQGEDHSLDLNKAFNFVEELAQLPLPDDLMPIFAKALPASLRELAHKPIARSKSGPRLKVAGIEAAENAVYRQSLARWRASGNRLGHCQHGGNYGQVASPCAAAVVEYSQDVFFTYGWSSQGAAKGNFVPMPAPLLSGELNNWQGFGQTAQTGPIIFVGTEMPVFGHRLDSHPTPLEYVAYRKAKAEFLQALEPQIRQRLLYRPYFGLPGTLADAQWLLPQFPEVRLCEGALLPQIQSCALLILDHHGTVLLEAMAADIPVILYWERGAWPLTPECEVLLEMLEAAGIWHPTPRQAAARVNAILANVTEFWQGGEVRLARKIFCNRQARAARNWENVWQEKLKEL